MGLWNLLNANIQFGSNGIYVRKKDCHEAHDKLEKMLDIRFTDLKSHFDTRVGDLKTAIDNYISLLKK